MEIAEARLMCANEDWLGLWREDWWLHDDADYIMEHIPFDASWRMMIASHMLLLGDSVWPGHAPISDEVDHILGGWDSHKFAIKLIRWAFSVFQREGIGLRELAVKIVNDHEAVVDEVGRTRMTKGFYTTGNIEANRDKLARLIRAEEGEVPSAQDSPLRYTYYMARTQIHNACFMLLDLIHNSTLRDLVICVIEATSLTMTYECADEGIEACKVQYEYMEKDVTHHTYMMLAEYILEEGL